MEEAHGRAFTSSERLDLIQSRLFNIAGQADGPTKEAILQVAYSLDNVRDKKVTVTADTEDAERKLDPLVKLDGGLKAERFLGGGYGSAPASPTAVACLAPAIADGAGRSKRRPDRLHPAGLKVGADMTQFGRAVMRREMDRHPRGDADASPRDGLGNRPYRPVMLTESRKYRGRAYGRPRQRRTIKPPRRGTSSRSESATPLGRSRCGSRMSRTCPSGPATGRSCPSTSRCARCTAEEHPPR